LHNTRLGNVVYYNVQFMYVKLEIIYTAFLISEYGTNNVCQNVKINRTIEIFKVTA